MLTLIYEFYENLQKDRSFRHTDHYMKKVFLSLLLISLHILLLMTTMGMATPKRISTDSPILVGGNKFNPFFTTKKRGEGTGWGSPSPTEL